MGKWEKVQDKILSGRQDSGIAFRNLTGLLTHKGFAERQKGSHHIFTKDGIAERIVLQSDGAQAKAYQVRQVRDILIRYELLDQ